MDQLDRLLLILNEKLGEMEERMKEAPLEPVPAELRSFIEGAIARGGLPGGLPPDKAALTNMFIGAQELYGTALAARMMLQAEK